MKRHLAIASAFLLGSAGVALADTVEGFITQIDPATNTIVVDDSHEIQVPQADLQDLQMGQRVIVTFEDQAGVAVGSSVIQPGSDGSPTGDSPTGMGVGGAAARGDRAGTVGGDTGAEGDGQGTN